MKQKAEKLKAETSQRAESAKRKPVALRKKRAGNRKMGRVRRSR